MSDRSESEAEPKPNAVGTLEVWDVRTVDRGIAKRVRLTLQDDGGTVFRVDLDAASARHLSDVLITAAVETIPTSGIDQ